MDVPRTSMTHVPPSYLSSTRDIQRRLEAMSWTAGPIYPCNPATARSESTKLGVDPKGEKLVYTNGRAVIVGGRVWGEAVLKLNNRSET